MLGKLLKHEFTATGRIMLPVLGALAAAVLLANLTLRFGDGLAARFRLLILLFILVIGLAFVAVIAAELTSIVIMVHRFYKNLLGQEGYLMHTLPVNVHQLVWSKLIVSAVWILVTNLVIILLALLSVVVIGRLNLGEIFQEFPSWSQIMAALASIGISKAAVTWILVEFALTIFLATLTSCLHFYAAMSLGHMFSNNKVLMSVVFFIAINIVFSILNSALMVGLQFGWPGFAHTMTQAVYDGPAETLRYMNSIYGASLVLQVVEAALLYIATVLGLKKKLNLA